MATCFTRVSPFTRCSSGVAEKVQMSWLKGGLATAAVSSDSAMATCRAALSSQSLMLHYSMNTFRASWGSQHMQSLV